MNAYQHPMSIVQCWDDGVTTDIRLTDIPRRFHARATFNLSAGLHAKTRGSGWIHRETVVERLNSERYEEAKKSGVFDFWGHSYEMISEAMWVSFEKVMERIDQDPDACWKDLPELF